MAQRPAIPYKLALPPFSVEELEAAIPKIHAWISSGALLSEAPIDALTVSAHKTLATVRNLQNDLQMSKWRRLRLEQKQGCLDRLRSVLAMYVESRLDVAGLQAMAQQSKSEVQEKGEEESEKAAKLEELATLLKEKEKLVEFLAGKLPELEAKEKLK